MKKTILFSLICIILNITNGCSASEAPKTTTTGKKTFNAIISIPVYKEYIDKMSRSRIPVTSITDENVDPNNYKIDKSKIKELKNADIYFYTGLFAFEEEAKKILAKENPKMKMVNLDISKDYPNTKKGSYPWLSLNVFLAQVYKITEGFVEINSKQGRNYVLNENTYAKRLAKLNLEINDKLDRLPNRRFIDFTNYFGFFAYSYALPEAEKEQKAKDNLLAYPTKIQKTQASFVFLKNTDSNNIDKIKTQAGVKIISINPFVGNYIDNMKKILEQLN